MEINTKPSTGKQTTAASGSRITQWYQAKTQGVSRNVQILLATEPLWAIPVTWVRTYASLFMAALGLSATQIGWIASFLMVVQMLAAPFGGYVADRYGRKKVLITFDTLAWFTPMVIWMFAQNVWFFVAAAFLNGVGMIIGPSWNCLLVEDTEPERRSTVFAGFQLVVLGAGLFSPLAGLIVKGYSVVMGTRILYGIAALSIGTMILSRAFITRETSVGTAMVHEFKSSSIRNVLSSYKAIFAQGVRNRPLILLFLLSTINFGYMTVWNTYSALYMTHEKGLAMAPSVVAAWPTFSAIVMILTLAFVVPKVHLEKLAYWLIFSSSLLCAGMLVFILSPGGSYLILGLSAVLIGVGTALMNPVRDTFTANVMDDKARAALMAGMNSLSMLLIIPLTPLAGRLFEVNPRIPLLMLLGMLLLGVVLSGALHRFGKRAAA